MNRHDSSSVFVQAEREGDGVVVFVHDDVDADDAAEPHGRISASAGAARFRSVQVRDI